LAVVAILTALYLAAVRTKYSPGFRSSQFGRIAPGDSVAKLDAHVGKPLSFIYLPVRVIPGASGWAPFTCWDDVARRMQTQDDSVVVRYSEPVGKSNYWLYEVTLDRQLRVVEPRSYLYLD
jgi:hypothetical protein